MVSFKVDNLKNMNTELKAFVEFLRSQGVCDDDIFAGKLVSCELITNVIMHGGEAASFKGTVSGGRIIITVSANSLKEIELKRSAPDVFAESGRGLYIINSFCNQLQQIGSEIIAEIILGS